MHLVALLERRSGAEAARYQEMLEKHHRSLSARRELCDEAWRCQDLLIAAGRARLVEQDMEAQRLYEQAILLAQRDGLARLFTIGSEMLGRFGVQRGLERLSRICLTDAHQGWLRWGASIKADALAAAFPRELVPHAQHEPGVRSTSRGTATVALQGILFDLGEAMRTARAISSEIVEERVVEELLRASCAYATITRAFAILMRDGEPTIAGLWTASPDVLRTTPGAPIATADLSEAVVQFVAQSHEPVTLTDSEPGDLFGDDPYLRRRRPKSLMCLPLIHQNRMLGMWYAESDVTRDLRRGSVDLLQLLAGQAASALVNARLVAELEAASRELSEANQQLRIELQDRIRIERERSELQERVIRMQEEMLQELSNPLIPISDSVIVLPIIGKIGDRRAANMVETVLAGVHERRARLLIIDVTGLREVDDVSARILLRLADALRLLGVRVVLTGVRPDVARTLVCLDVDMSDIVVRSTLRAGIAFATSLRRHA
jgi:anti-anti-sigma regulatory factor